MIFYLRCAFCEAVMAATNPIVDAMDRLGMGGSRLYRMIERPNYRAWDWLDDAKPELQKRGRPIEA